MNKETVSENKIDIYCKDHRQILSEMDNAYRCMRTLTVTDELISKMKDHVCQTMLLWRKLKIPVTPSAHLFEDHIVNQMENIIGGPNACSLCCYFNWSSKLLKATLLMSLLFWISCWIS